ncbi:MAG: YggS family pyridoxal phosphate-dependent enzyme [Alphaproteobacteria bacterium]|jgi:pyridoxal phosphate enzyme (YggS family)|nr:YggS family pyridoxal phosphate-dependent enzyme [Thalassospira sp.]MCE2964819.1 YggS family pyridoxal phosphate-dependent enzyme [Alphaproteobacteria bacterium]
MDTHSPLTQLTAIREHCPDTVTVLAVTKTIEAARIVALLDAGHRHFAENRVQEAAEKWPALRKRFSPIELHLIGALQTNKAKEALALFDVIETLDRAKLLDAFAKFPALLAGKQFYVQVNTGREPQKAGVLPEQASPFIEQAKALLPVTGLMCIPPVGLDPMPHFAMLAELKEKHKLQHLSIGMSGDWQQAIKAGATHIRVGSALFGARA